MDYPRFPKDFSREAKSAVIMAEVDASRTVAESAQKLSAQRLAHGGPVNKEAIIFQYIMTVFYAFAREACYLGLAREWSIDVVDREAREFLRLTAIHARARYRHRFHFREITSNYDGSLLPEIQATFESTEEWRQYQDDLLTVGRLQHGTRAILSHGDTPDPTRSDPTPPNKQPDVETKVGAAVEIPEHLDAEKARRQNLLAEYRAATGNPSKRSLYEAKNSGIYKPEFYDWVNGKLPANSATAINFERFLRNKKQPIPRKPKL
jgi:hypothetical protein